MYKDNPFNKKRKRKYFSPELAQEIKDVTADMKRLMSQTKHISKLDEITSAGRYVLITDNTRWIDVVEVDGGYTVKGPIGRKKEQMTLTVGSEVKVFKSIDALVKHLKNCSKKGFWQMDAWRELVDSYKERIISEEAEISEVDGSWVYVMSPDRKDDCIRLGFDCSKDVKAGDKGKLVYVSTPGAGLIKFIKR